MLGAVKRGVMGRDNPPWRIYIVPPSPPTPFIALKGADVIYRCRPFHKKAELGNGPSSLRLLPHPSPKTTSPIAHKGWQ